MKKRIAILGIYHESNTFSPYTTSWADLVDGHLFYGEEIRQEYQLAHHEIGGFLQEMEDAEVALVPVFFADIIPGGTIGEATYATLKAELLQGLDAVLPVDGVYLCAHGAAVSERIRDVDGDWMQAVRSRVGKAVPVVGTLDPHANVSLAMQQATDGLIAYATNPHLDQRTTGKRAAGLLKKILFHRLETKQELIQFPASLSIEQQETSVDPCRSLYQEVASGLAKKGVISHSVIMGFPYADVEEMGTSLLLISERSCETDGLKAEMKKVVRRYFPQFAGIKTSIEAALAAKTSDEKPVLLLDMGDNVGGGAPGNSTYLLDALEAAHLGKACICIHAPDAVRNISDHGLGEWMDLHLGGANPANRREPYRVQLLEKKRGKFMETEPRHGGQTHYDMGETALVQTALGNLIVLMAKRVPPFSSQQLRIFDIALEKLDWIIAKGVNAPIAAYKDSCPLHIKVNTPGACNADATQLSYQYRRKPMIPFEEIADDA